MAIAAGLDYPQHFTVSFSRTMQNQLLDIQEIAYEVKINVTTD